jgi:hypothetical protein
LKVLLFFFKEARMGPAKSSNMSSIQTVKKKEEKTQGETKKEASEGARGGTNLFTIDRKDRGQFEMTVSRAKFLTVYSQLRRNAIKDAIFANRQGGCRRLRGKPVVKRGFFVFPLAPLSLLS